MDAILHAIVRLWLMLPSLGVAVGILFLGKLLYACTVPYKFQEQLTKKDNPAFGICFLGYLAGLGIAVSAR